MTTDVTAWRKSTRSGAGNDSDCVEVRRAWRKSTYSGAGIDSSCIEVRRVWRKSTLSGGTNTSDCVEVSPCSDSDGFHLRDSKLGDGSPVFDLTSADLRSLLGHAR
ncbi:DUF397 domain-containing protein [Glycomyces amatae]|uniref:DUF397 domain-containing protein n=1 Tax=Glycomyces amatae TaxID=2881355 RepID=UPI0034E1A866